MKKRVYPLLFLLLGSLVGCEAAVGVSALAALAAIFQTGANPRPRLGIERLGKLVRGALKDVLDAFAHNDVEKARDVWQRDEEIDQVYTGLFRELLTYMMEDPRNITQCTHLLFCTKSLERVGDHATNIAEAAYYLETGRHLGADETARGQR